MSKAKVSDVPAIEAGAEEIEYEDGEVFLGPPVSDDVLSGLFLDLGDDPCLPIIPAPSI